MEGEIDTGTQLLRDQADCIASFRHKWETVVLSTARIHVPRLEDAFRCLYAELGITSLKECIYYPSPYAAMVAFAEWQPRVGSPLEMYWPYQLPLCDPASFWRQWGDRSPYVDLGVRRTRNALGCYASGHSLPDAPGELLTASFHQQAWAEFERIVPWDWAFAVKQDLADKRYEREFESLQDLASEADPTCQVNVGECVFLGPYRWLVREVAAVDFCHTVLGARRNQQLYQALEGLLTHGSFCLTFENLLIVCDRPVEFRAAPENRVLVSYQDGHAVLCRRPGNYARGISDGT